METGQEPVLQMPSFLYGPYDEVEQAALAEGYRCARQYRQNGSFSPPRELLEVPPGEVVVTRAVVDFQHERPAWRLYMLSKVLGGLRRGLNWQDLSAARELHETSYRETAWGALGFAILQNAPMDKEHMALRLQAVLRFWEPLQSVRYLHGSPDARLTLEELMMTACDWLLPAWCPESTGSIPMRLEMAAERMLRATREDSIEAILRQLPRTLPFARGLAHPEVLGNPHRWREHLATLAPDSFTRLSAASPAELLEHLYDWDRQLQQQ
jgi:hypothetical protein